jgi:hypothetical protein
MGTAGNVNHINVWSGTPQKGSEEAARIGTILAAEILKTIEKVGPVSTEPLQVMSETVKLGLPPVEPGGVEKARQVAAKYGKPGAAPFLDLVHAFRVLETAERKGEPIEAEVQVIALGDQVAWVGLPGEIFAEFGLAIKLASPFRYTIISTLSNGAYGYFPNLKAFAEGNYEPISARTEPGSGERLAETATRLLVDSYRVAVMQ